MFNLNKAIEYLFYLFVFVLPIQTGLILREPFINGAKWQYGTIIFYLSDFILLLLFGLFIGNRFLSSWRSRPGGRSNPAKSVAIARKSLSRCLQEKPRNCFVALFLNFASQILKILASRNNKKNKFITVMIIIFVSFSFFSIFYSPDKQLSTYSFIRLTSAIALFFIILNIKFSWKKLLLIFLLSALLQSGLGLWQFFSQKTFAGSFLGISEHNPNNPRVSAIITQKQRWLRSYGGFPHPNILGGYLAITLLFAIGLYLNKQSFFASLFLRFNHFRHFNQNNKIKKLRQYFHTGKYESICSKIFLVFLVLSIIMLFATLISSFSRSAWLAFGIGFLLTFIFNIKEKNKKIILDLTKISILFFIIASIFIFHFPQLFQTRLAIKGEKEIKSITERIDYTVQAKNLIKSNWLGGVGIGNYTIANYQKINKPYPAWYFQPVHNVYLLIFAELGLIGFILFLGIIIMSLRSRPSGSGNLRTYKNNIFFTANLSLLIIMLFDHYLWTSHFGLLFFWLIFGLTAKSSLHKQ